MQKYTNDDKRKLKNPAKPLVTAYIPTRNRADSLERAIQSVIEQTWSPIEIIVVDDASEDETQALLEKYSSSHSVNVVRNERSLGAAACRNLALQQASGEFVAGLDDDDIWRPKRVEKLLEPFDEGYAGTCSYDRLDFGERELIWKKKPLITLQDLLFYNQVGNQILTKRDYIMQVGGYDESLPSAQDYDLWIRLAHDFGSFKTAPHTLQVVNMQAERESITTAETKLEGYFACFEKHASKMNPVQKKYQHYRLKLAAGKKMSWAEMFRSVPFSLLFKEITRKLFFNPV